MRWILFVLLGGLSLLGGVEDRVGEIPEVEPLGWRVWMSTQLDYDGRFPLSGASGDRWKLDMRRAKPTLYAKNGENLTLRLTPEFSPSGSKILEVYGDVRLGGPWGVRVGNFKPPVGLERFTSSTRIAHNERGYPAGLSSSRDLGVEVRGGTDRRDLSWKAGIFRGAVDGSSGAPSFAGGGVTWAGAVEWFPCRGHEECIFTGIGLGMAASVGTRTGPAYFRIRNTNRGDVVRLPDLWESGTTYRLNPQLTYYRGSFGFLGEYLVSARRLGERDGTFYRVQNHGWTLSASYVLTGEENLRGRVVPLHPVGVGGGWGAWELAARYSALRVDDALLGPLSSGDQVDKLTQSWTGSLRWHMNKYLRMTFSIDHTVRGAHSSSPTYFMTRLQAVF